MVNVLFRLDIGYDPERGYAAVLVDVKNQRMKGIKGNSVRQLMRNISSVVAEEEQKMRSFPLEQESRIITQ